MAREINIKEIEANPTSYVDPNGRLFHWQGGIYRAIALGQADFYRNLLGKGPVSSLIAEGQVVKTKLTDLSLSGYGLVLEHEKIENLSYCVEWPMIMLKKAALLTIDICLELSSGKLTLQDAYPWNVYFKNTQPVFVDFGSIVPVEHNVLWTPYQQFCRFFLYPLYLAGANRTIVARNALKDYLNGITDEEAAAILPFLYKLRHLGVLTRLELPLLLDKLISRISRDNKKQYLKMLADLSKGRDLTRPRTKFFQGLRGAVAGIRLSRKKGTWFDYYGPNFDYSFSPRDAWNQKQRTVLEIIKQYQPRSVLDVACNKGWFSLLAAKQGCKTIAFDKDESCVASLYDDAAKENLPVEPLVMDILNPTPAFGWRAAQFPPAHKRLACEMVFAFALIHHLVFKQWQNFDRIFDSLADFTQKWLLIEFVGPEDERVKDMWEDRFGWYNFDNFLDSLKKKFSLIKIYDSYPKTRKLVLAERRGN